MRCASPPDRVVAPSYPDHVFLQPGQKIVVEMTTDDGCSFSFEMPVVARQVHQRGI